MTKCFGSGELTYLPSSFFRCSTYSSDTSPAATSASTQALVRLRAFCLKQMSRSSVPMPYWLLALDAKHDGFELALALTRDHKRREQDFGRRVDADMVAELIGRLPAPPRHVFVCGGNPF